MLRNYYLTALRNLLRHKSYFFLNMSGLAIGITSFIFISLFIINELSYDQFHSQAENIHRIHVRGQMMGQDLNMGTTAAPMSKVLLQEFPEVLKTTRIKEAGSWFIGYGEKQFNEDGVLFADSTFFDVFDFQFVSGGPDNALNRPKTMVMTESTAKKYFGDEEPLGKRITVERDTVFYEVTGIIKDVPGNSHVKFDMLGSMVTYPRWDNNQWGSHNFYSYVVLDSKANISDFDQKMQELVYKYFGPQVEKYIGSSIEEWEEAGNSFGYYSVPLTEIHLHSHTDEELEANSDISYIYIYSLIACILLFIAIINFINLATAQSSARSREVGVRKVLGSSKYSLIYQFIFESILIAFVATAISALLVYLLTPRFELLINKSLSVTLFSSYISFITLSGLAIIIGVMAGFYPAFVLAGFQPTEVLKGRVKSGAKSGWLRNVLVTVQFTASIVIIIGTIIVYNQTDYMLNRNLGFDKEQTVVVRRPDVLSKNLEAFKEELKQNPQVTAVANSMSIPGKNNYNNNAHVTEDNPNTPYLIMENSVSFEFADAMGLELVAGRFFSKVHPSDSNALVINETTARLIGYADDAIGKNFLDVNEDNVVNKKPIIGVVKDYNIRSLHNPMDPVLLRLMPGNWEGYLIVKLQNTQNIRETIAGMEESWFKYSSNRPFQYFFYDEDYSKLYASEATTGNVFLLFAGISIFIASLGLIGLITFTTAIRKKEISIRKVMGAGTGQLIMILSSEFIKMIIISTIISWPLAYFAIDYWLQNFADRLSISPWTFIGSTLLVVAIGGAAISFQTIKASLANPTDSLRQE